MKKHILNRAKAGEIWAVSLGNGEYGYLRILRDASLGVIPIVSRGMIRDPRRLMAHPPKWFFGFGAPPEDATEVFRIGTIPFTHPEEAWPPPQYMPPDFFKGYFQIVEKGVMRRAEEAETKGLQKAQMASPDWLKTFILNQRREFASMEGDGPSPEPSPPVEDNDAIREPTLLEIVLRNADFPLKGRDMVEEPLAEELERAGVGEVTGGGSGSETSNIDVEVSDVSRGVEVIRRVLKRLKLPSTTEIHQYSPEHIVYPLEK